MYGIKFHFFAVYYFYVFSDTVRLPYCITGVTDVAFGVAADRGSVSPTCLFRSARRCGRGRLSGAVS